MITTSTDDPTFGAALATLWQRHRQTNLDRIALLEATTAKVLRAVIDDVAKEEGAEAAHKLAGSLGTFGFDAGSRAASEAETLLREPVIDGRLLAEAVTALRSAVQESEEPTASVEEQAVADHLSTSAATIRVVSQDPELISRLTVEAAANGLVIGSATELPTQAALSSGQIEMVVVDDDTFGFWPRSEVLHALEEVSLMTPVVVLTTNDDFRDRVVLADVGVIGVLPRSQGSRQTISFVSEELFKRRLAPFTVLATNAGSQLIENLKDALNTPEFRLTVRNGPSTLWEALEMQGADLVVIGFDGTELQGPQLCHVIRSHPRWHRTPILIVGSSDPAHLEEAFAAGSDDYLSATASATECLARVQVQLKRGRLDQVRSDLDPLTGTANRTAAERSMDALLRLAKRKNEPFALALLAVDHLNQIHDAEGSALLDIVLRRLGATLERSFRGEDTVGRWNDDGFAVGIYGATSELASSRMAEVLRAFESDGFVTTSGKVVRYTLSAGVACSPGDGSTLSSLERVAKAALRRAKSGQNRVVVAGERTSDTGPEIFDVVLIEDDDSVADVVSHALGLRNYDFERFSDGAEAARALGDGHVSGRVVLLDVGLPSLDGFGVLRTLRAQGVLDETRVIMLTARSSEAETLRALGLGATEHITKPFSIPVLLGRLDQSLTRSAP